MYHLIMELHFRQQAPIAREAVIQVAGARLFKVASQPLTILVIQLVAKVHHSIYQPIVGTLQVSQEIGIAYSF
jgi:hypothetical protein